MSLPLFTVDSFTEVPFKGNPAGVCLLSEAKDAAWMQNVAAEMKHAETAFLVSRAEGYDLRWFTPAVEVNLCGHATLASAHILFQEGRVKPGEPIRFFTRSGELKARREGDMIVLDFPTQPAQEIAPPPHLLEALGGVEPLFVGQNDDDYLVCVSSAEMVKALSPDFAQLKRFDVRGVIVTASDNQSGVDFVSRFFAPGAGIDEDPVTGSAHCCLAVYWNQRLHKTEFIAHQLSARGGVLRVTLAGDRVLLGGHAVTVWKGSLLA
ncbi:MAG TPA: PhzF family phenazine biosynthesis protein [bacterium]|jgi:PhzF family phenazine biosynthesis protein